MNTPSQPDAASIVALLWERDTLADIAMTMTRTIGHRGTVLSRADFPDLLLDAVELRQATFPRLPLFIRSLHKVET